MVLLASACGSGVRPNISFGETSGYPCLDRAAVALVSEQPVDGAWSCFDAIGQAAWGSRGVSGESGMADFVRGHPLGVGKLTSMRFMGPACASREDGSCRLLYGFIGAYSTNELVLIDLYSGSGLRVSEWSVGACGVHGSWNTDVACLVVPPQTSAV